MKEKKILDKIAQLLLLNSSFNNNQGLLFGKMGALIFLYNYDQIYPNDIYFNYANELTVEVSGQLTNANVNYFSEGLAGIGWGMKYLIKNDFIEDSPIFSDLDTTLIDEVTAPEKLSIEFIGVCNYLRDVQDNKHVKFDSLQEEFNYLMKKEMMWNFMDLVLMDWDSNRKKLSAIEKINDLYHVFLELSKTQPFFASIIFFNKIEDQDYEVSVNKLLDELLLHLRKIIEHVHLLIHSASKNKEAEEFYADLIQLGFYELYNCYVNLHQRPLYVSLELEFFEIARHLDGLVATSNKLTFSTIRSCNYLRTIAGFHKNEHIDEIAINLRRRIINYLDVDLNFDLLLDTKNKNLNIGLGGIAGLGLTLLQELEINNWNAGLLI